MITCECCETREYAVMDRYGVHLCNDCYSSTDEGKAEDYERLELELRNWKNAWQYLRQNILGHDVTFELSLLKSDLPSQSDG